LPVQLKNILDRLKAWWDKFTSRQKTVIISCAAGLLVTIAIVGALVSRPRYIEIVQAETAKQASEIVSILQDEGIPYTTTADGLRISVPRDSQSAASLALGANDVVTAEYDLEKVFDGGFTMTESDKQKRYSAYLESTIAAALETNPSVKDATVKIWIPENSDLLITTREQTHASAVLELKDALTSDAATAMATFMANALGNADTNNIVILDGESNMLFSGTDDYTIAGSATGQLKVKQEAEQLMNSKVKTNILGLGQFDDVTVSSNLTLDFNIVERTEHTYTPAEGQEQGVLAEEYNYEAESTGSNGGIPGTDSNTQDTTYVIQIQSESSSTTTENSRKYLPNETITSTTTNGGAIISGDSSIALTLISYKVVHEEDAELDGSLAGTTWEEYKKANEALVPLEVDEQIYNVVAMASGLPVEKIAIVASQQNMFFDSEGFPLGVTDIITIVLILVIVGLLAVVVLRTLRPEKVTEPEEVSVEHLLSQQQEVLEEIPTDERSEARKMIDKFVDENPEAVANLLRNWLQEDW